MPFTGFIDTMPEAKKTKGKPDLHTQKTRGLFPASKTVSFRLDYQIATVLEQTAKKYNMNTSDFLRKILTDYAFKLITSERLEREHNQLVLFAENTYDKFLALEKRVEKLEKQLTEIKKKD
jgi:hypothetical protein